MKFERRKYDRVNLDLDGTFYLEDGNVVVREFPAKISNISENGIGILIDQSKFAGIGQDMKIGYGIRFQAFDDKDFSLSQKVGIVQGNAEIVRVVNEDNNSILVGCRIDDNDQKYRQYVNDKRVVLYFNKLRARANARNNC